MSTRERPDERVEEGQPQTGGATNKAPVNEAPAEYLEAGGLIGGSPGRRRRGRNARDYRRRTFPPS